MCLQASDGDTNPSVTPINEVTDAVGEAKVEVDEKPGWNWPCDGCKHVNKACEFPSGKEFARAVTLGTSLKPAAILPHVKCVNCDGVRRWRCGHPSCGAETPMVVVKPGSRVVPWMKCLSCGKLKTKLWSCVKCGAVSSCDALGSRACAGKSWFDVVGLG